MYDLHPRLQQSSYSLLRTTGRQPGGSSSSARLANPLCWPGGRQLRFQRNIQALPCPRCTEATVVKVLSRPVQVGKDANSSMLHEALDESGVALDHLRAVDGPSGTAVILVQPSGENSILIVGDTFATCHDHLTTCHHTHPHFVHRR